MNNPVYHIIENFFKEDELQLILKELEFLNSKLLGPAETSASESDTGRYNKQAKGIFLDHIYANRNISDILKLNRKIFEFDFINSLIQKDIVYRNLLGCNHDMTLINYYENNDYYDKHSDAAVLSCISFFYKEPKKFTGGDFIFNDFNIKIPIKNNMLIIFPSYYEHQATPVKMKEKDIDKGLGRYSMVQFLNFKVNNQGTFR